MGDPSILDDMDDRLDSTRDEMIDVNMEPQLSQPGDGVNHRPSLVALVGGKGTTFVATSAPAFISTPHRPALRERSRFGVVKHHPR